MTWLTSKRLSDLKAIMKDDYDLDMSENEVETFGRDLVEAFDLLLEADRGQKFECPSRFIDTKG